MKMTPKQENEQGEVLSMAHHDHTKGLNSHAFFKISDHDIGEDLVQETFLKTWKYLLKGGKIDVMKAFLYHVLNDLIVDQYRKKKTTSLEILIEKGFEPSIDDTTHLFNILDGKSMIALIKLLPKTYRKVMTMKYIQGLSIKEMAHITGKTKNTIAVLAHRGLIKIKVLYKGKS